MDAAAPVTLSNSTVLTHNDVSTLDILIDLNMDICLQFVTLSQYNIQLSQLRKRLDQNW